MGKYIVMCDEETASWIGNDVDSMQPINLSEIIDKYTKRISRIIDEQTLANIENQLAEYGYVKVMWCRDCKFNYEDHPYLRCKFNGWIVGGVEKGMEPDGFCKWGKPKENNDD